MPRKIRIEYPGAVYHVMSRGDHQEAIFQDDEDRVRFLTTLGEACEKTGWRVHAYVLMGNHYHLLLKTPEPNLSLGMKWFQGTYTQRFNSRHKVFGHLFQGRYKALNVDDDSEYFATVASYIHLNPVRAGLVSAVPGGLKAYRWSSFPQFLQVARKRPFWLETATVFQSAGIGRDDARSRRRFESWMDAQVLACVNKPPEEMERAWRKIRRGWYLGGESFKERLLSWLEEHYEERDGRHDGGAFKAHHEAAGEELLSKGLMKLGVVVADLKQMPKGAPEKMVLAWWLRKQTTVSRNWISERLFMGHPSRVTTAVREVGKASGGPLRRLRRML